MEVRQRLVEYQQQSGLSWQRLADVSGIPLGTLSPWKDDTYNGRSENITAKVRRFLDGQQEVARIRVKQASEPGWLPTPSGKYMLNVLRYAHTGDVVSISSGPGTGKTYTAEKYITQAANVHIATMTSSVSSTREMAKAVLKSLGDKDERHGATTQQISSRIIDRVRGKNALIILDEAQDLTVEALKEARSWHDACGVGLAIMGDQDLIKLLQSSRKTGLATFNSRIGMQHIQREASTADVDILLEGWGVSDPAMVKFLRSLAPKPGGLRGIAKTIRLARTLLEDDERLSLSGLKAAWAQRNVDAEIVR